MEFLTLSVASLASALAFVLPPAFALAVYISILLWYPAYLAVNIGGVNLTASRILIFVLFFRFFFLTKKSRVRWCALDTAVAINAGVALAVVLLSSPTQKSLINLSGHLTDTMLAYCVGRIVIGNWRELIDIIKPVSVALAALAVLGVYESITHRFVFDWLRAYCPWYTADLNILFPKDRFGLSRAMGPYSHAIMFGCVFSHFMPLVFYLRHQRTLWRTWAYPLVAIAAVGAVSSMSSGPLTMLAATSLFLFLEKRKFLARPLLAAGVLACVLMAVVSKRPFYHVIFDRLSFLGGGGWHRARMIDAAIDTFSAWAPLGSMGEDPGWGSYAGMPFSDITNEFLLAGADYGAMAIISLIGVIVVAYRSLLSSAKIIATPEAISLYWAFGSWLSATILVWMSVSYFGQMPSLFFLTLGLLATSTPDGVVDFWQTEPR